MLREVLRTRIFVGGFLFFVLLVVGGVLYLRHVDNKAAEELMPTNERVKQLTEKLPAEAPVAEVQRNAAKKQSALYQQQWEQYLKDHRKWRAKQNQANTEWVQAGETLDNIGSRDAGEYVAYVRSLSETEKRELTAKLQDASEKYLAASEKLTLIIKEEPVPPTPPKTN